MTKLSPAARAVLDAATPALNNFDACGFSHQQYDRKVLAAALRAAAQQVIEEIEPVEALISIAAELEGSNG